MAEEVKDPSQQTSEAEESMEKAAEAAETDAAADVATETEAAAAEADATVELQQKIETLEKELADEKEKYLRLDAEYYNYRTRSLKEKQDAYDNALTKAVTEVLSVIDNFERALTAECADANFKKGVEMIFRQYTAILEKLGVKEIEAEGKPFDPNFHNAVSQITDENLGENTVAAVLQKGYIMGNKVIRHAMVTVANP